MEQPNQPKSESSGYPHKLTNEDRSKGGKTVTPKKRLSNSLKAMKTGKYSQYPAHIMELAKDQEFATLDILNYVHNLQELIQEPSTRISLARLKIEAYKAIHGEKKRDQNLNVNLTQELAEFYDDKEA